METHPTPVVMPQTPPPFQNLPETLPKAPLPCLFPITGPSTSGPGAARRDGTWRRRDRARGLPEPAEGHSGSREAERAQGTVTTDTACNLAQENPTRLDTGGHITPPLLHSQTQSQSYQRRPSVAPQARALPHTELQGCWDGGWPLITHCTTPRPAQAQEAHPR